MAAAVEVVEVLPQHVAVVSEPGKSEGSSVEDSGVNISLFGVTSLVKYVYKILPVSDSSVEAEAEPSADDSVEDVAPHWGLRKRGDGGRDHDRDRARARGRGDVRGGGRRDRPEREWRRTKPENYKDKEALANDSKLGFWFAFDFCVKDK